MWLRFLRHLWKVETKWQQPISSFSMYFSSLTHYNKYHLEYWYFFEWKWYISFYSWIFWAYCLGLKSAGAVHHNFSYILQHSQSQVIIIHSKATVSFTVRNPFTCFKSPPVFNEDMCSCCSIIFIPLCWIRGFFGVHGLLL